MPITNIPKLIMLEKPDKYMINVEFLWESYAPYHFPKPPMNNGPVTSYMSNGIVDTFDALGTIGNVQIPIIKTIIGVVNFSVQTNGVHPNISGELFIQCPDTGMMIALSPNIASANGLPAPGTTTLNGIAPNGMLSFCLPVITNGTAFNFTKLQDSSDNAMHGGANVSFLTYALPPYIHMQ